MKSRELIGIGAAVLAVCMTVSSAAAGAPSRFTPRPHAPDGAPGSPGTPPVAPPVVPPAADPPAPGNLTIIVDTASRIRATLVAPNRIELQANVPWRLIATARGMCVLAEGDPTGVSPRYITLPEDAVAYWVTPK